MLYQHHQTNCYFKLSLSPEFHNRCTPSLTVMSYIYSDEQEIESQPEEK